MTNRKIHPAIEELKATRLAWQLPTSEVAFRAGVSARCISGAESGEYMPKFNNLVCWAEALGKEVTLKPKD